ncbi:MAG: efflux RND transporter periplasmic adaptor subunit [Acidobacteriia bacterium]|nr:efflux RND transporter periplasmic adaptor subunit [Terriglobia bacterium]
MNQRNRIFALLGVLLVIAALYYWFSAPHSNDIVLIGTVDANQVAVSSKILGRIEKLNVDEGSQVQAGDVIAVLDTAELEAQQRAAKEAVSSMESKVAETRHSEVQTQGESRSGLANVQARLQAARASLRQAEAQLVKVETDNRRTVALAEQGVASKQDLDRSNADLTAQRAAVASLRDQVRAAQADVATAQARLHLIEVARSTVVSTEAQTKQAQAQLNEAETRLGYTSVLAPISGTVSVRVARQGEVVNPGEPIVTIVDLSDTWVRAYMPETEATNIGIGEMVRVKLPSGDIVKGKVILKGAEADFATQRDVGRSKRDIKTVGLKISVPNPNRSLVPGMTADVLISPDQLKAHTRTEAEAQSK